ncbi:hypothetical protein V8C86DRAFT_2580943, partial [Haematococcus lacustris]
PTAMTSSQTLISGSSRSSSPMPQRTNSFTAAGHDAQSGMVVASCRVALSVPRLSTHPSWNESCSARSKPLNSRTVSRDCDDAGVHAGSGQPSDAKGAGCVHSATLPGLAPESCGASEVVPAGQAGSNPVVVDGTRSSQRHADSCVSPLPPTSSTSHVHLSNVDEGMGCEAQRPSFASVGTSVPSDHLVATSFASNPESNRGGGRGRGRVSGGRRGGRSAGRSDVTNRTFFHARTGAAMTADELLPGHVDSDDGEDTFTCEIAMRRDLQELSGPVTPFQRELMLSWNSFQRSRPCYADGHVPLFCREWLRVSAAGLRAGAAGQLTAMRAALLEHLLVLYDFGLLDSGALEACLQTFDCSGSAVPC